MLHHDGRPEANGDGKAEKQVHIELFELILDRNEIFGSRQVIGTSGTVDPVVGQAKYTKAYLYSGGPEQFKIVFFTGRVFWSETIIKQQWYLDARYSQLNTFTPGITPLTSRRTRAGLAVPKADRNERFGRDQVLRLNPETKTGLVVTEVVIAVNLTQVGPQVTGGRKNLIAFGLSK